MDVLLLLINRLSSHQQSSSVLPSQQSYYITIGHATVSLYSPSVCLAASFRISILFRQRKYHIIFAVVSVFRRTNAIKTLILPRQLYLSTLCTDPLCKDDDQIIFHRDDDYYSVNWTYTTASWMCQLLGTLFTLLVPMKVTEFWHRSGIPKVFANTIILL